MAENEMHNKRMRTDLVRVNVHGRVSTHSPQEFAVVYCAHLNTLHVSAPDFWIRIPLDDPGCIIGSLDQMGMVAGRTLQQRIDDLERCIQYPYPLCISIMNNQEAAAKEAVSACDDPAEPMFVVTELRPDGFIRIQSPRVLQFHLSLHLDVLAPFLSRRNDVDVLTIKSMPSLPCVDSILAARSSASLRYAIAANGDNPIPTVDQLISFLADCTVLGALAIFETSFYSNLSELLETSTHPDAERARWRLRRDMFVACIRRHDSEGLYSAPFDAEVVRRIVDMIGGQRATPAAALPPSFPFFIAVR
jgi:hypothetical protein